MFFKIGLLEALLKKLAGWRQATLSKKDSNKGVFLWSLWKFVKHLYRDCFCTSGGYICTFLKKWLSSYFANLLWRTNFFFSTYRLNVKSRTRLFSGFLNNFVREYPIKLKISIFDHLSNTFWNTVFRYLLMCLQWLRDFKGRVNIKVATFLS